MRIGPGGAATCTTNNGNIQRQTIGSLIQDYTYADGVNRLTSAVESGGTSEWSQTYGHDAYGNHWVSANSGVVLSSFTPVVSTNFDAKNRLQIQNATYDTAG